MGDIGPTAEMDEQMQVQPPASFKYVRKVDPEMAAEAMAREEVVLHSVLDGLSGAEHLAVNYACVPPEKGSPGGRHIHEVEQVFYIIEGAMRVEVEGREFLAEAGNVVVFPKGVPHMNWNDGPDMLRVLSFNSPLPDPARPIAIPVK